MADNTINYGLPYPEGADGVVVHKDIELLAQRLDAVGAAQFGAVDTKIDGITSQIDDLGEKIFYRGDLRNWHTLSALETGAYSALSGNPAAAIGIPEPAVGTLIISRRLISSTGLIAVGTAMYVSRGDKPKIWISTVTDGAGTWSDWRELGGEASEAQVTEYHAFLVAGQSNMSGHGTPYGDDLDPPNNRILQYGATRRRLEVATVPLNQHRATVGLSPATVFAREYLQDKSPNVGVILIAAARGASYLEPRPEGDFTWYPGGAATPFYDLYTQSVEQTQELLNLEERASLKGVLWLQGEGNSGNTEDEYADYQDFMISKYREDLNDPALPFMVGELVPEGVRHNPGRGPVNVAISKTPARLHRTAFVNSKEGLAKYGDHTHYSRSGVEFLGKGYLHAYKVALTNTEDSDPTPVLDVKFHRGAADVHLEWTPPLCRYTGYQVQYRTGDNNWITVDRENPMYPAETVPVEATEARVITLDDTRSSFPLTISV